MDDTIQSEAILLFQQKQYAEAATAFRSLLTQNLSLGQEADTRRRLADTLASLGQSEEAEAERELAENLVSLGTEDPLALMTKGDLLKRSHQYDEACMAYEQALRLLPQGGPPQSPPGSPSSPAPSRARLMAMLAIAHYEASRPAKTVLWAMASLVNQPDQNVRRIMHRMAGVGYSDLGDLKNAQMHYVQAFRLAEMSKNLPEIAQSLATLGMVQRKRGLLEDALTTARMVSDTILLPSRTGQTLEAECLRDLGRFEEARVVVAAMRQGPRWDRPDLEQRTQAICSLTLVWIEANADQPKAALTALQEAWHDLGVSRASFPLNPPASGGEDKLILYCDAAAVRVYAQLGQPEIARQMQQSVESRVADFDQNRAGLLAVYSELAPAALLLSNSTESLSLWHKYLDCRPDIIGQIKAHFGLGEAFLALHDTPSARAAFQQAVAPGIDSYSARRAQARLEELGG